MPVAVQVTVVFNLWVAVTQGEYVKEASHREATQNSALMQGFEHSFTTPVFTLRICDSRNQT